MYCKPIILGPNGKVPVYKTKQAACADVYLPEDVTVPAHGTSGAIPTDVKAYMQEDEVLILANRSSNPKKKGLILSNSIGVVDADYYGNQDNDGHIMFAFYNIKEEDITIKKGECIGQGIFQKFLKVDNDNVQGERTGGFGSTNK